MPIDTRNIVLNPKPPARLDPNLFDGVAQACAQAVAIDAQRGRPKNENKPSQLRKFYDELVMWQERVGDSREKLDECLPFIRMLNAKAAYAEGRKLVDRDFTGLLAHCLKQVDSPQTLANGKVFMEAFMGFYKAVRPKD